MTTFRGDVTNISAKVEPLFCRWLGNHPVHRAVAQMATPDNPNAREQTDALSNAQKVFELAAVASPWDADVQTALGVLHHLSGNFTNAAAAFESALKLRPSDYSLWNKLGATLANSSRSEEAKAAYQQALKWKPNYMRAWANMGISHGNLGEYQQAAYFYLKALLLNSKAYSVWGYLRTALVLMGRSDLLIFVDQQDLQRLQAEMPSGLGPSDNVQEFAV